MDIKQQPGIRIEQIVLAESEFRRDAEVPADINGGSGGGQGVPADGSNMAQTGFPQANGAGKNACGMRFLMPYCCKAG